MKYNLINKLRKKLKDRKPVIGTWLQTNNCLNAEILANNKFDWIAIDIDMVSDLDLMKIRTIESCDVVPLFKISKPDVNDIKHALDSGSYGV